MTLPPLNVNCPATVLVPLNVSFCPALIVVSPFDDTPATVTLPAVPVTFTVPIDDTAPVTFASRAA
ncbi:hypothetical protein R69608_07906 [Paraburkholderia nemoris]|nr:hypothetical protein R69608_07906 [Paraburkholderia nemoris]